MTVDEYVAKAKQELDLFAANYQNMKAIAPNCFPESQLESEWVEQERAARFGEIA